ncbi:hypothetical protein [Litorivivens sp.]|uniref:hypothetical protein n=1 Tax=Litorivivens sp. TaxID=2020868 RepID=UPI003568D8A9
MTIGRMCTVSGLVGLLFASLATAGERVQGREAELPVTKLSPVTRSDDRGTDYYQAISCRELGSADAKTPQEIAYLDARKRDCVERYRAFAPRSFQP